MLITTITQVHNTKINHIQYVVAILSYQNRKIIVLVTVLVTVNIHSVTKKRTTAIFSSSMLSSS